MSVTIINDYVLTEVCACVCFSGLIGRSWSMVFVSGGYNVNIFDNVPGQAAKAITEIRSVLLQNTALCPALVNSHSMVPCHVIFITISSHSKTHILSLNSSRTIVAPGWFHVSHGVQYFLHCLVVNKCIHKVYLQLLN